jgi:ATP:corrinoid adenosyltransferase
MTDTATVTYLVTLDRTEWEIIDSLIADVTDRLDYLVRHPSARSIDERQEDIADSVRIDKLWQKLRHRASDARQMFVLDEQDYEAYLDIIAFGHGLAGRDLVTHPLLTAKQQAERLTRLHG